MDVRIDLAVLLAIIIVIRLMRQTEARSRSDEKITVIIVLVFGILVAQTAFGHSVLGMVGAIVSALP